MNSLAYSSVLLSLFAVDFVLGHGILDMFQKIFCSISCVLKNNVKEESKKFHTSGVEIPISLPLLMTEILFLLLTLTLFNRFKRNHSGDRINQLLQKSKEEIHSANNIFEKWNSKQAKHQVTVDCPYLDEEPQEVKPLKLEVPILHMAIIDTLGPARNQPERGDAGDTINLTDAAFLSITSLIDDDYQSTTDNRETSSDDKIDEKLMDFNNRYLWDVMEEDNSKN